MLTCCSEHLSVGTQAAVQYSCLVSGNLDISDQRWVAPDADRVVREPTGAHDLSVVVTELETRDLGAGVDAVDPGAGGAVPEVNVSVVRATARGQKVELPRAPAKSFDSRRVVLFGELGRAEGPGVPDGDQVVVATSGELSTI